MAHIISGQEKVIIKAVSPNGSINTGDIFVVQALDNGTKSVTVDGNLTVTGTQTINQSVSLAIEDKFLEINRNNSTAGTEDSGIFFDQGSANAALLYYDGNDNEFLIGTTTNAPTDASISNITLANIQVASPTTVNHAASKQYVDTAILDSDSIIVVGDDSTGSTVKQGETLKVVGTQNITTAVGGQTLTITGPDLTSYVTASSSTTFTNKSGNISQWTNDSNYITDASLSIVGDDSTGTTFSAKNSDDIKITGGTNITTAVSGNTVTITGPDVSSFITASSTTTLTNKTFDANGTGNSLSNVEVSDFISSAIVTASEGIGSNNNDTTIPTSAAVKAYADSVSGGGSSSLGDLTAVGSTLTAPSNADLTIQGGGTGAVNIEGIKVQGDTISSADSTQILIDDAVRMTGSLTTPTLVVNTISAPTDLTGTYTISSPTTITLDPTDEIINDAPMKLVNKTVAQLGSLTASTGSMVFCTNESGGAVPCFYDGSNWRRVTDRAVVS